jgi:hypothetical protein
MMPWRCYCSHDIVTPLLGRPSIGLGVGALGCDTRDHVSHGIGATALHRSLLRRLGCFGKLQPLLLSLRERNAHRTELSTELREFEVII